MKEYEYQMRNNSFDRKNDKKGKLFDKNMKDRLLQEEIDPLYQYQSNKVKNLHKGNRAERYLGKKVADDYYIWAGEKHRKQTFLKSRDRMIDWAEVHFRF